MNKVNTEKKSIYNSYTKNQQNLYHNSNKPNFESLFESNTKDVTSSNNLNLNNENMWIDINPNIDEYSLSSEQLNIWNNKDTINNKEINYDKEDNQINQIHIPNNNKKLLNKKTKRIFSIKKSPKIKNKKNSENVSNKIIKNNKNYSNKVGFQFRNTINFNENFTDKYFTQKNDEDSYFFSSFNSFIYNQTEIFDKKFKIGFNEVFGKDNVNSFKNKCFDKDEGENPYNNIIKNKIVPFNYEDFKKNNPRNEKQDSKKKVDYTSIDNIFKEYKDELQVFSKIYEKESQKIKEGIIFKNTCDFLENGKSSIDIKQFYPDSMINKFKTFILEASRKSIIKYNTQLELKKIGKNKVNGPIRKNFNEAYLEQKLYDVFSNSIKNKEILEKIRNNKKDYFNLNNHLDLTIRDCINYITYKNSDKENNFPNKIYQFLLLQKKIFTTEVKGEEKNKRKKEKMKNFKEKGEILKNDYIFSLILISYNFERFFYMKKGRDYREKNCNKTSKKKIFRIEKKNK